MDEAMIRDHIQEHADAVVREDMDRVAADFAEEFRPRLPILAKALPQPVLSAEVLSVTFGNPVIAAVIKYSGESGECAYRSDWQDLGGAHPMIVHVEPVG
jgi:hypothetical protein